MCYSMIFGILAESYEYYWIKVIITTLKQINLTIEQALKLTEDRVSWWCETRQIPWERRNRHVF